MDKKPIFRDFDLPTMHLEGLGHYVPPKSRHDYETARRRELRSGVLLAEYQRRGLLVAATILENISESPDINFASRMIGSSAINSAWYGLARKAPVMRRRLKLPILAEEDRDYMPNLDALLAGAVGELDNAASFAAIHIEALKQATPETKKRQISLGRVVGNASLTLACLTMDPRALSKLGSLPDDLVQQNVRRQGLMTLHQGLLLADEIGSPPSLAQLADPDSDLSVFWRRNAPGGAYEALELATETHRAA